jgi:hypothetical protein
VELVYRVVVVAFDFFIFFLMINSLCVQLVSVVSVVLSQ